jgi:hypothetical protein
MKKLLTLALLLIYTGCASMQTAQDWLNDPKNQALIGQIATTVITIVGALGEKPTATTQATVVGKLSAQYPDVPAGALRTIAAQPRKYAKTAQH